MPWGTATSCGTPSCFSFRMRVRGKRHCFQKHILTAVRGGARSQGDSGRGSGRPQRPLRFPAGVRGDHRLPATAGPRRRLISPARDNFGCSVSKSSGIPFLCPCVAVRRVRRPASTVPRVRRPSLPGASSPYCNAALHYGWGSWSGVYVFAHRACDLCIHAFRRAISRADVP